MRETAGGISVCGATQTNSVKENVLVVLSARYVCLLHQLKNRHIATVTGGSTLSLPLILGLKAGGDSTHPAWPSLQRA